MKCLENRTIDLRKSITKGLNIVLGPPSIGKTTLLNTVEGDDDVIVQTWDQFSEEEYYKLSQQTRDVKKSVLALLAQYYICDNRKVKYVVDAHPFFIEEMLDEIMEFDSVNIILLVDKFPVPDEACLRYANNNWGNPEKSRIKYATYYYDLIDFLCEDAQLKYDKKTLLLNSLVTTYLFR